MTIKDFILECENYSHSKEHYELMKEAYEIDLMNQYVSDQLYMKENAMFEGYYSEAAEEDKVEEVKNEANAKTESLLDKIGKKLKEIIDGFIAFLAKFIPALRKQVEEEKKDEKDILDEEVPSTKEDDNKTSGDSKPAEKQKGMPAEYVTKINRIGKAMPVILQHKDIEFTVRMEIPNTPKLDENGKRAINAAYSDSIRIRKVEGDREIVSIDYIDKILRPAVISEIVKNFNEGLKEFKEKGISIDFHTIDKDLEKCKKWKSEVNKDLRIVNKLSFKIQEYINILNVTMYSITTYMKVLTAFLDFRTKHRENIIKMTKW